MVRGVYSRVQSTSQPTHTQADTPLSIPAGLSSTRHTHMKPPCVCSRLGQSAGAVYDLTEEVGQLIFQLVPC